ncbi:FUSC family protein [Hyphomicrobium sp. B1]|uniref:FUSC family protein n=1 Tax=Hyphomicrobium sp. B1 TaxID=3075651 RepID=UPI003C2D326A
MAFPALQQWIFSFKTTIAALLALLIALWLPLPNPYWSIATVYIASNPLSGATRSKAIFRVIGTLLGASAAIAMVPNLVNTPILLIIALGLWSAGCLYIAMLDRTPRSYIFMLAGYTAALIGFPTVDVPGTIFDVALARTEEIIVGILCAAVVSSIILPRPVAPVIALRLKAWLANADVSARDALQLRTGAEPDRHRLKLAGDTGEIENLSTHLIYDAGGHPEFLRLIRDVRPRMLMLIPILSSIADRLHELSLLGGPSRAAQQLVDRMDKWLAAGGTDAEELDRLRSDIEACVDSTRAHRSWHDLVELSLLIRLGDLAAIRSDCLDILKSVEQASNHISRPYTYPIAERAALVHHYDHGLAMLSAVVSFATISICCTFWILLSWPEGGYAVLMAAVAGNLFSAQDNPVPSIVMFAKCSVVSIGIAALYVFGILPHVHNFETLALVLAPALIFFGLCISKPETLFMGLALAICVAAMMGLQVTFKVDTSTFWNSSIATSVGVILAATTASMLRTLGAEWSIRRLAVANKETLAEIADAQTARDEARLTGVMLDRLVLLAPRAKAAEHRIPGAIGELREGFNILDLRRSRIGLTPYSRRRIDAVLLMLKRYYQNKSTVPAPDLLLAAVNRALAVVRNEHGASARSALLGLVGLRRSLFPDRSPPHLPHAPVLLEAAQ